MQKEINKLLKQVNAEKLKKNHKECIELYNIIGGIYSDISSYEEAIHYHGEALTISKTLGDTLNTAIANRHIGEAKAALGNYDESINHIGKYLTLARKVNNTVEIQRAWTTFGRVYLMQAQDLKDSNPRHTVDETIREIAQEAEKRFQTALNLAETVRGEVEPKEFAQMKSGLLTNLGIVKDICGQHGHSISNFNKAIDICKSAKIKEDLYRCQIILAGIYRQHYNVKLSVKTCEEALVTAKQIGRKLLICDAYIERGLVKILQRDFKEAKKSFAQAYLEKSPSEEDHLKAIKLTKLAHLINETYEKISSDGMASESRFKLCDKLGDLFVALKSYRLAIEFYRRAFTDARASMRPKQETAAILYSLAETYADDGQFSNAILCYEKELSYRDGNNAEQVQSLVKIAYMRHYLGEEPEKISDSYEKALLNANNDPKLMYTVLKDYVPFAKKTPSLASKSRRLEETFLNLKSYPELMEEIEADNNDEQEDGEELDDEIANIDDIITDDEDNDEVLMVGRRRTRAGKKFKRNEVGDTPLHEACINGDLKRVKSLLGQGHEVNPRDNAGWIPLHEACNHGHYQIVEYLIENGADVSNRGLNGMSPLHDAATNGHFDIMRLLMRSGANVIALTDSGETVLNCFRDFKKRYQNDLTNRQLTDYKHLEIELMNQMDKCGYNLMEVNQKASTSVKSRQSTISSGASADAALHEEPQKTSRPKLQILPKPSVSVKRKRIIDDDDEDDADGDVEVTKATKLPATFETTSNPSAKTKDWLLEDDVVFMCSQKSPERDVIEDYKSDSEVQIIESPEPEVQVRPESSDLYDGGLLDRLDESWTDAQQRSPAYRAPSTTNSDRSVLELTKEPLCVIIQDKKMLIPVKEEHLTIEWLKDSISQRYALLVGVRPKVKLYPEGEEFELFDQDLCRDVIKSRTIIAKICSLQLKPLSETFDEKCQEAQTDDASGTWRSLLIGDSSSGLRKDIIKELRTVEETNDKLELQFTRFPTRYLKIMAKTLAWRDFTSVDLSGCSSLFCTKNGAREMIETIGSWRRAKNLRLRCLGLGREEFESLASSLRLPELDSLDLSFNSISFKCRGCLTSQLLKLSSSCPKLKRLDLRKNKLAFASFAWPPDSATHGMEPEHRMELLAGDQNDYAVYGGRSCSCESVAS